MHQAWKRHRSLLLTSTGQSCHAATLNSRGGWEKSPALVQAERRTGLVNYKPLCYSNLVGSVYCHILRSFPTALGCRFWKVKSSLHQNTEGEASHFTFSGNFRPGVHIYLLLGQMEEQLGDKIKMF